MGEVLCLLHIDVVAFHSTSHGRILMADGELLGVGQLSFIVVVEVACDQCSASDVSIDYLGE